MPHCRGKQYLISLQSCLRCTYTLRRSHVSHDLLSAGETFQISLPEVAKQQVWLVPSILIEALDGPKALGSWHAVVNPLQAVLAPLGRGPLLQEAAHAVMHSTLARLKSPHQKIPWLAALNAKAMNVMACRGFDEHVHTTLKARASCSEATSLCPCAQGQA